MLLHFLQDSVFLQALGMAILNSLWQTLVLWILYKIILLAGNNIKSPSRHNLAIAFILGSFAWFVVSFYTGLVQENGVVPGTLALSHLVIDNTNSIHPGFFSDISGLLPYLSAVYLTLIAFLLFRLVIRYRSAKKLMGSGLIPTPAYLDRFTRLASKAAAIARVPAIWISKHLDVPATIGFIKPIILIPVAAINQLSTEQLEAIILHELSHIKRHDYLINLLLSIVETFLFFNPFAILLMKEVRKERENCCDDFVLNRHYDSHTYATALVQLEDIRQSKYCLAMGAVSGRNQLFQRIKRITGGHLSTQTSFRQKLLGLLLTIGIFISLAWLLPEPHHKKAIQISVQEPVQTIQLFAAPPIITNSQAKNETEGKKENRKVEKAKTIPPDTHSAQQMHRTETNHRVLPGTNKKPFLQKVLALSYQKPVQNEYPAKAFTYKTSGIPDKQGQGILLQPESGQPHSSNSINVMGWKSGKKQVLISVVDPFRSVQDNKEGFQVNNSEVQAYIAKANKDLMDIERNKQGLQKRLAVQERKKVFIVEGKLLAQEKLFTTRPERANPNFSLEGRPIITLDSIPIKSPQSFSKQDYYKLANVRMLRKISI